MQNPGRVDGPEPERGFSGDIRDEGRRERTTVVQNGLEVSPFDPVSHERSSVGIDVADADDVRVIHAGGEARFIGEPGASLGVGRGSRSERLQQDDLARRPVDRLEHGRDGPTRQFGERSDIWGRAP